MKNHLEEENWKYLLISMIGLAAIHAAFIQVHDVRAVWLCTLAWTFLIPGFFLSAFSFCCKPKSDYSKFLSALGYLCDFAAAGLFISALWSSV